MKIKGIKFEDFKSEILKDTDVLQAYILEKKNEELREKLLKIKSKAQLTSKQIADKMQVSPPMITNLEKNAFKSSIATLERYANACNAELHINLN